MGSSPGGRCADADWQWLGRIPFAEAVLRNAEAAAAVRAGARGRILAFEPAAPVFTLGRRAATEQGRAALAPTLAACTARGVACLAVDRGGLGTLHLPGQAVLFLALPCQREQLRDLVRELLQAAAAVAAVWGVAARVDDAVDVGLWSDAGKLASIGLAHSAGVVSHGLALNVAIDAGQGAGLTLCGRGDACLASLAALATCANAATPHAAVLAFAKALALPTTAPRGPSGLLFD